jgi:hypothetical protein
MTPAEIAALYDARPAGSGWSARCPAHDDRTASLSISPGDNGGTVLHCHAGCDTSAVLAAKDLRLADLAPNGSPPSAPSPRWHPLPCPVTLAKHQAMTIEAVYPYQDEMGALLYQVLRYYPKTFRQRRPDPSSPDGWSWKMGDVRRVPFHLPQLLDAIAAGRPVWIAEGEKDVLALEAAGFAATCNPGGAGKWPDTFADHFAGSTSIVIVADKDEPGRKHAQDVAAKLATTATNLVVIEVPDVGPKRCKDAADYFANGGQPADLDALAQDQLKPLATRPFTVWRPSQFMAWQEPPGSHLLLPAYITLAELTAIVGQAGVGKTRLILWLAICQILQRDWCGLVTGGDPANWLIMSDENSISRLKRDLTAMIANFTADERARLDDHLLLHAIVEEDDGNLWLGDPIIRSRLVATVQSANPGAVIFDPLANLAPEDPSKPAGMKDTIRLVSDILRRSAPRAARILVHHARPGRQNILGGVGFDSSAYASGGKSLVASARCQINVMPGSEEDPSKLVVSCGKINNCEPFKTRGVIFNGDTFTFSVDETFDLDQWRADVEGKTRTSSCTTREVVLAVNQGWRKTADLAERLAETTSAKQRTIERAISRAVKANAIMTESHGVYMLGPKSRYYLQ